MDHHTKGKSISARTQPISIPRTQNESISIATLNKVKVDPPDKNRINFDETAGIKSIRSQP